MKHTKKLIPALGMLLLSACMLVTSTFAWFSMNTEVYAHGMQVKAVGEQVYLQIRAGNDAFSDNAKQNEAETKQAEIAGLKPVTVGSAATVDGVTKFVAPTTTPVQAGKNAKWATSVSNDENKAVIATEKYTVLDSVTAGYAYSEEFRIRLNPSAGVTSTATMDLTVSSVSFMSESGADNLRNAVSVFVVLGDYGQLFTQGADGGFSTATGDKTLTVGGFTNPDANGYKVTVYVFFDGEHEDCTSANLWAANEGDTNHYQVQVNFALVSNS